MSLTLCEVAAGAQGSGLQLTVEPTAYGCSHADFAIRVDVTANNATEATQTVSSVRFTVTYRDPDWFPVVRSDTFSNDARTILESGGLEPGVTLPGGQRRFSDVFVFGHFGHSYGYCPEAVSIRVTVQTESGMTVASEAALGSLPGPWPAGPAQPLPVLPIGAMGFSVLLLPALLLGRPRWRAKRHGRHESAKAEGGFIGKNDEVGAGDRRGLYRGTVVDDAAGEGRSWGRRP